MPKNDISMLKLVKDQGGLAVAVGNAMPKTKNSANFTTAPVTQDGFAKAIDKIIKIMPHLSSFLIMTARTIMFV